MDFEYTDLPLTVIFFSAFGYMLYHFAIVAGVYKEPLLRQFRRYGEEYRVGPLARALLIAGITNIIAISFLSNVTPAIFTYTVSPESLTLLFVLISLLCFAGAWLASTQQVLGELLPVWYFRLLRNSTREERRFIAFAWLRLPRKMRWRLNADHRAFQVWADMVRIAFIYGAHDPDSPWDRWQ